MAVSISEVGREPFTIFYWNFSLEEVERFSKTAPPRMLIGTILSITLYNGLRDADERDRAYNSQNLYQHGIPQPHNHLLWERVSSQILSPETVLNHDSTSGDKPINEHDCGDNQQ
jgi:hypothetical protein